MPLVIAETTESTTSLVIGELSATEEHTIKDVMKTGLGVGLSHPIPEEPCTTKQVPSASAAKKEDLPHVELELKETPFKDPQKNVNVSHTPHFVPNSLDKPALPLDTESKADTTLTKSVPIQPNLTHDTSTLEIKNFSINVQKLTVKPGEIVHTSNKLLATYPLSKFRPPGYYPITTQDTDQESIASNMTEIYWPIDLDKAQYQSLAENKSCSTPNLKDNKTAKFKFNILLYSICRKNLGTTSSVKRQVAPILLPPLKAGIYTTDYTITH